MEDSNFQLLNIYLALFLIMIHNTIKILENIFPLMPKINDRRDGNISFIYMREFVEAQHERRY